MNPDNKQTVLKHEVVFYTYPKFIFCWPLIAMGFLLWGFDKWQWLSPETLAWIWGVTLIIVLITVGFDLNRNYTIFWMVLRDGSPEQLKPSENDIRQAQYPELYWSVLKIRTDGGTCFLCPMKGILRLAVRPTFSGS